MSFGQPDLRHGQCRRCILRRVAVVGVRIRSIVGQVSRRNACQRFRRDGHLVFEVAVREIRVASNRVDLNCKCDYKAVARKDQARHAIKDVVVAHSVKCRERWKGGSR